MAYARSEGMLSMNPLVLYLQEFPELRKSLATCTDETKDGILDRWRESHPDHEDAMEVEMEGEREKRVTPRRSTGANKISGPAGPSRSTPASLQPNRPNSEKANPTAAQRIKRPPPALFTPGNSRKKIGKITTEADDVGNFLISARLQKGKSATGARDPTTSPSSPSTHTPPLLSAVDAAGNSNRTTSAAVTGPSLLDNVPRTHHHPFYTPPPLPTYSASLPPRPFPLPTTPQSTLPQLRSIFSYPPSSYGTEGTLDPESPLQQRQSQGAQHQIGGSIAETSRRIPPIHPSRQQLLDGSKNSPARQQQGWSGLTPSSTSSLDQVSPDFRRNPDPGSGQAQYPDRRQTLPHQQPWGGDSATFVRVLRVCLSETGRTPNLKYDDWRGGGEYVAESDDTLTLYVTMADEVKNGFTFVEAELLEMLRFFQISIPTLTFVDTPSNGSSTGCTHKVLLDFIDPATSGEARECLSDRGWEKFQGNGTLLQLRLKGVTRHPDVAISVSSGMLPYY